jgi:hypothetical protein
MRVSHIRCHHLCLMVQISTCIFLSRSPPKHTLSCSNGTSSKQGMSKSLGLAHGVGELDMVRGMSVKSKIGFQCGYPKLDILLLTPSKQVV